MNRVLANTVSSVEAMRLVREGHEFECPICHATIETIPKDWRQGMQLSGLACPTSQKHFLIYGDDADTLREYREVQRLRRVDKKT